MRVGKCTICLESVITRDLHAIHPCGHSFHQTCIDQWLSTHPTCPNCKTNVTPIGVTRGVYGNQPFCRSFRVYIEEFTLEDDEDDGREGMQVVCSVSVSVTCMHRIHTVTSDKQQEKQENTNNKHKHKHKQTNTNRFRTDSKKNTCKYLYYNITHNT